MSMSISCTSSTRASLAVVLFVLGVVCSYAEVRDIDSDTLTELSRKGVPVIDVRTPEEWFDTGVVPGSMLLTFFDEKGDYDIDYWLQVLGKKIDYDQPFILICDVGVRTAAISQVLSNQLNMPKVYNVKDGIRAWMKSGGVTVPPPFVFKLDK